MRCLICLSFALIVTASLSSATHHEVTLQPGPDAGKDSYISSAFPDSNFGDETYLTIFYQFSATDIRTAIQFNLDPYIGVSVDYATLWLYCYAYESPCIAEIFRINGSWDEHTLTWNNKPGFNHDIVSEAMISPNDWIEIDVAEIVQSWLSESYANNGFYIWVWEGLTLSYAEFYSSDYTVDPDWRPKLEMGYTYTGVAPSSYGAIKAAFR